MKETFGQKLARLRKEKGLTQEDVAQKMYVSPQAVSKWENDISSPDISVLPKLADLLGVSIDELLDHQTQEQKENEFKKTEEVIENQFKKFEDDDDEDDKEEHKPDKPIYIVINSVFAGLCLLTYLLLGFFTDWGWYAGWIVFLFIPIVGSITNAIKERKITYFAYPVLVVAAYCSLGFLGNRFNFDGWGFYWFLFLTIPAFYMIFGPIDTYFKKKRQGKI